ncbi:prepilin peptidase [Massilia sp. G4R7]|uniref:Prepilin peptidase n=1 Tax=Massilia phyllostachyos TaxID=2898585 RepID=A0ABS8QCN2_9BURK|nr:prepilin peptidase [Massilia phyllostachyos]MCD2519354.1 prepilin peptidase [Massilia phyllostachyos]
MVVAPYLDTLLLLLAAAAAINDLASRRIPNLLLLCGLAGALVLHALSAEPGAALLSSLGGFAAGLLIFLPFYLVRGMAAGDVKMMATVGAFTGPATALHIAIMAWCAGGAMALAIIVLRGRLRLAVGNLWRIGRAALLRMPAGAAGKSESAGSMPYGVAIAAGTIYVIAMRYS